MNVVYEKEQGITKLLGDIPVGTVFTGQILQYPARLFLRVGADSSSMLVSLDHPELTWTACGRGLRINNYMEVNATITVH